MQAYFYPIHGQNVQPLMHTDTHDTPRDDTHNIVHQTPPAHPDDTAYDEDDEVYDEPHSDANRALRLILLVLVLAMIALFVLFVAVPFVQSMINPTPPNLTPAIQT